MAKQIVINKSTGEKFQTTDYLSPADVARLTGMSPMRDLWKSTVMKGQPCTTGSYEIEKLNRYLKPLAQTTQAQTQTPRTWRDDPATGAQLRYLASMEVQVDDGISKGQASQLIEFAKRGELGSTGGFYTDGSN